MKTTLIIALVLGMNVTSFSQNKINEVNDDSGIIPVDLPEVVIKNAGKDFSFYLPDKNPDPSIRKLESDFIAYNLGKDYEGFDNFLVVLQGEKGNLTATYDVNGKLTSVIEKYDNTQLPISIMYSVYKSYPGWEIVNDKYLYSQENGDIKKKEYNLKLKKNNEIIKLTIDPRGEIIAAK